MNLHGHIPELLDAGVCSFKIEGRMRSAEYLRRIVETYADALDRFLENPSDYDRTRGADRLLTAQARLYNRLRAGPSPPRYTQHPLGRTGRFYSTGRVFSEAVPEPPETPERVDEISAALEGFPSSPRSGEWSWRYGLRIPRQAELHGSRAPTRSSSRESRSENPLVPPSRRIWALEKPVPTRNLAVQLPRMMDEDAARSWEDALGSSRLVGRALYRIPRSRRPVPGPGRPDRPCDTPRQTFSTPDRRRVDRARASLISVSLEAGRGLLRLGGLRVPVEVTVHGRITAMFMENDAYRNVPRGESQAAVGPSPFPEEVLCLTDALGQPHPVLNDAAGRSHLLTTRSLRLWALVPDLARIGVPRIRIETTLMSDALLASTIRAYRARMGGGDAPPPEDRVGWTLEPRHGTGPRTRFGEKNRLSDPLNHQFYASPPHWSGEHSSTVDSKAAVPGRFAGVSGCLRPLESPY
jgi:putative protease